MLYVWTDTWAGSETESCPGGSLNHFTGHFFQVFLQSIILICLVRSSDLVYLRILPCLHTHLSAQMDSSEEACG